LDALDPIPSQAPGAIDEKGFLRRGPSASWSLYANPQWQLGSLPGKAPLRLGTWEWKGFLSGAIEEVAIDPHVLTVAEIQENLAEGQHR
jgi:hypothetical protein